MYYIISDTLRKDCQVQTKTDDGSIRATYSKDVTATENKKQVRVCPFPCNAINTSDDDTNYMLSIDIPGVKQADVNITIQNDTLVIEAERMRGGTSVRAFKQTFHLPEMTLDTSNATASLSDGVLIISFPKLPVTGPMKVEVQIPVSDHDSSSEEGKVLSRVVDMPGVRREDVHIEYEKQKVMVRGERKIGKVATYEHQYNVNTRKYDLSKLAAFLADGILTIKFPLKEEASEKGTTIAINAETMI